MLPARPQPADTCGPGLTWYCSSILCAYGPSRCLPFHMLLAFLRVPRFPPRMSQALAGLASHWAKPLNVMC